MNAHIPDALQAAVNTIIEVAQPEQIILFGSRAKGTANEGSDYDCVVTGEDVKNEREISRRIYRALLDSRIGVAVDVVVVTTAKLKRHTPSPFFVYRQALKEGKLCYERHS